MVTAHMSQKRIRRRWRNETLPLYCRIQFKYSLTRYRIANLNNVNDGTVVGYRPVVRLDDYALFTISSNTISWDR